MNELDRKLNQIVEITDGSRSTLDLTIYRRIAYEALSENEVESIRADVIDELHENAVADSDNEQAITDLVEEGVSDDAQALEAGAGASLPNGPTSTSGTSKQDLLAAARDGMTEAELITLNASAPGDPLGDLADDFEIEAYGTDASRAVRTIHSANEKAEAERERKQRELEAEKRRSGHSIDDFGTGTDEPPVTDRQREIVASGPLGDPSSQAARDGRKKAIINELIASDGQVDESDRAMLEGMSLEGVQNFAGPSTADGLDAYSTGVQ